MDFKPVNTALDIFCILICCLLVGYLMRSPDRKERLNRIFVFICIMNMGMLLGDLPNWLCEGYARSWFPIALRTGVLLQFLCGAWLPIAYSEYLAEYLSSKFHIDRHYISTIRFFGCFSTFFVILNLQNGMFYYIDQANVYHRGDWWWLSQAIAVLVLIIDMGVILMNRRHMAYSTVASFLFYIFMPIPAIIVQSILYGLSITYPASTLAIVIIFLNIQADQALLVEQKKKELAENQMDIMLSQIQPHFLYNTLTAIAQLCRKDPKKAEKTTIAFAAYLRTNMNSLTQKCLVPFKEELRHTRTYLYLEKVRFGDELTVVYDIQTTHFYLPVLTIQPLVENAVKHGVGKREDGGEITISVKESDSEYIITISDNGVGFDPGQIKTDNQSHIGINNVRLRLEALAGGTLEVKSQIGSGTTVTVKIPLLCERKDDGGGAKK